MNSNRPALCRGLLLALLLSGAGSLHAAEVECGEPQDADAVECRYLLIAGITEEPDPINVSGAMLGSSTLIDPSDVDSGIVPQIVTHNGITVAVWAESNDGNGDIVFSEWRTDGWQQQVLTDQGSDERDPRVGIADDGAIFVTWWETDEPRQVRVVRRDPVSLEWDDAGGFSGIYGARPSVLLQGGGVLLVFERRAWFGGQQIVARLGQNLSGPTVGGLEVIIAGTTREGPLEPELHQQGGQVFVDWIHDTNLFGYSEYEDGAWGASLDDRPLTQRHWAQFPFAPRLAVTRTSR